jgi:hypothetical protein
MESPKSNGKKLLCDRVGFAQFASSISDTNPLRLTTITRPENSVDYSVFSVTVVSEDFLIPQFDYVTPQSTS